MENGAFYNDYWERKVPFHAVPRLCIVLKLKLVVMKQLITYCNIFGHLVNRWMPPALSSMKSPEHTKEISTVTSASRSRVSNQTMNNMFLLAL